MNILHISDLHFDSTGFKQSIVLKAFHNDINKCINEFGAIELIIFSGDIVKKGDNIYDYEAVQTNFIDALLTQCAVDKNKIFFTPGNHDVQMSEVVPTFESSLNDYLDNPDKIEKILFDQSEKHREYLKKRLINYNNFITSNGYNADSLNSSDFFSTHILNVNGYEIGIANINTSTKATGHGRNYDYGNLILGVSQVEQSVDILSKCSLKIINFHHSFDWLKDFERYDIRNQVMDNFDLVLFGHNHEARIESILSAKNNSILVNAGALYEYSGRFTGYSIINVEEENTTIYLRSYFNQKRSFDKAINLIDDGFKTFEKKIEPNGESNYNSQSVVQISVEYESIKLGYESFPFDTLMEKLLFLSTLEIEKQGLHTCAIMSVIKQKYSSKLTGFSFYNLNLQGFDFSGLDLSNSEFILCDLSGAFFTDVILENSSFEGVNLNNTQFLDMNQMRAVQFNDKNQIVSGGSGGAVINWETKQILRGHHSCLFSLKYSFDYKYLAAGHENGRIHIWDKDGIVIKVLSQIRYPIYSISWNPDEREIFCSTGKNGIFYVWNITKNHKPMEICFHNRDILSIHFSANGQYLCSVGIDKKICITESKSWTLVSAFNSAHKDYIRAIDWKNNDFFATGSDDGYVKIWEIKSGNISFVCEKNFGSPILSLKWNPTNWSICLGLRNDKIVFWNISDINTLQFSIISIKKHIGRIWDVCWSNDGKTIITAGNEGDIIIWKELYKDEDFALDVEIEKNAQVLSMNFNCHGLKLKNLFGLSSTGYQVYGNKDRQWEYYECSVEEWLLNQGAIKV